jgi:hypothetical protein
MTPSARIRLLALCTVSSLALSVTFFAPRLWLMRAYVPGTFQWDRAHAFLLQCDAPFRSDVEAAMRWRLLPPLVCHGLGLRGWAALAVPWVGVVCATAFVAALLERRNADPRFIFGGTLLFSTTSAVLAPVGRLGINDAWAWLGLLAVAFADSPWTRFAACLLCPWVDERFIIGLPLALAVRAGDRTERRSAWAPLCGLLPYVAIRAAVGANPEMAAAAHGFVLGQIRQMPVLAPLAPLAWWMGLRAGWAPTVLAILRRRWLLGGGALLTLVACLALASDMSRCAAILAPLMLLGAFGLAREHPAVAPRALLLAGVVNLLIPAAHVSYTKVDPVNVLPVEVLRLLRDR